MRPTEGEALIGHQRDARRCTGSKGFTAQVGDGLPKIELDVGERAAIERL